MQALVVTGHGEAGGDAELLREATEVVSAIEVRAARSGQVAAVLSLLIGTGFHDPHDVVEAAHLRRDAERIVAAVTTGRVDPGRGMLATGPGVAAQESRGSGRVT